MQIPTISLTMAAALGLAVASSAVAQPTPAPSQTASTAAKPSTDSHSGLPSFGELDKKNRGYLTRSDIPKQVDGLKPLRAHFMESDTDHNGRLSPSEYATYVQSQTPDAEKPPGQP